MALSYERGVIGRGTPYTAGRLASDSYYLIRILTIYRVYFELLMNGTQATLVPFDTRNQTKRTDG
jgi:hypothetical protein